MIRISDNEIGEGGRLFQLKIKLRWSNPPIWRRVVVPPDIRLDKLHLVIQIAMPWTNSHLHQFKAGKTHFGVPHPDYADMGPEMLDEKRRSLADIAPAAKAKFIYEYDFGDGWEHEVLVEKLLPPDAKFKHPVCLAGKNACPPDDCGGIPGYHHLLEVLANPNHSEHQDLKEWIGCDWDPAHFDLDATNAALKKIKL